MLSSNQRKMFNKVMTKALIGKAICKPQMKVLSSMKAATTYCHPTKITKTQTQTQSLKKLMYLNIHAQMMTIFFQSLGTQCHRLKACVRKMTIAVSKKAFQLQDSLETILNMRNKRFKKKENFCPNNTSMVIRRDDLEKNKIEKRLS